MKRFASPLLALAFLLPVAAQAHDIWIVPSSTVLSGDEGWVTVDAAVGNDKFYFNHRPMNLSALQITGPDGKQVEAENKFSGELRSGFDVHLTTDGTYRIALASQGATARWKEDGKMKRWFGPAADLAKKVPAKAEGLEVQERVSRVETFVTKGKPTAIGKIDQGISLVPVTHPNDLFAGEKAKFIATIDGKPAARIPVEIVPGGSRYRDTLNTIELTTNDKGEFEVKWPQPGQYWLHITSEDKKTSLPQASKRSLLYSATLEVLPQ